jgi:hypothetical protein
MSCQYQISEGTEPGSLAALPIGDDLPATDLLYDILLDLDADAAIAACEALWTA